MKKPAREGPTRGGWPNAVMQNELAEAMRVLQSDASMPKAESSARIILGQYMLFRDAPLPAATIGTGGR